MRDELCRSAEVERVAPKGDRCPRSEGRGAGEELELTVVGRNEGEDIRRGVEQDDVLAKMKELKMGDVIRMHGGYTPGPNTSPSRRCSECFKMPLINLILLSLRRSYAPV